MDEVNVKDEKVVVNDKLANLSEKNKQLVSKLATVELEVVETEKEIKASIQKHEKTVQHLHDKLLARENTLEEKEKDLDTKKCEILLLEKVKVKDLESFKKEVLKKEKKLAKKKKGANLKWRNPNLAMILSQSHL